MTNYRDIITIEPGKRGGKPCIRGMRITVYAPDLRGQDVCRKGLCGGIHAESQDDESQADPKESDLYFCAAHEAPSKAENSLSGAANYETSLQINTSGQPGASISAL